MINFFKLFRKSFKYTWVIMLYYAFCVFVILAVSFSVLIPVFNALKDAGILNNIADLSKDAASLSGYEEFSLRLSDILLSIRLIFSDNISVVISYNVFLYLIVGIISRMVFGLIELPIISCLNEYMSTRVRGRLSGKLMSSIGKSLYYQLLKSVITIPLDIILLLSLYGISFLFGMPFSILYMPMLIILAFTVFFSLRFTLTCYWPCAIVCDKQKPLAAAKACYKMLKENNSFLKILSRYTIIMITIITLFVFFGLFTFGAALIILIPLVILTINIINIMLYYTKNKLRYYVDDKTIVCTGEAS